MSEYHNLYEVLRLNSQAEDYIIHAAYRVLANKFHPDKNLDNPEAANRNMQAINDAYAILSAPEKRRAYDLQLQNGNQYTENVDSATSSSENSIGREMGRNIIRSVLDEIWRKNKS